jgi:hypothetical protein
MTDPTSKPEHDALSRQQRRAIKAAVREAQNPEDSPEDRERFRAHLKASQVFYEPKEDAHEEGRLNDLAQPPSLRPVSEDKSNPFQ